VTGQQDSRDDADADERAEDDQQLGAVATQAAHEPRLAGGRRLVPERYAVGVTQVRRRTGCAALGGDDRGRPAVQLARTTRGSDRDQPQRDDREHEHHRERPGLTERDHVVLIGTQGPAL
jgi:hypothetical protein